MDALRRHRTLVAYFICGVAIVGALLFVAPPSSFPLGQIVSIERGSSAQDIAKKLADANIISNPTLFNLILRVTGAANGVRAGAYRFDKVENALSVAYRLRTGGYGIPPVQITFIEGMTVLDYARSVERALPEISGADFIREAKSYEGYLFPETYTFSPSADAELVVSTMRSMFDKKVEPLMQKIEASGHSLKDVVTMASLLEREARSKEVRQMIAGILWKRLELKMPLQVDAVFGYIFGRETFSPSYADLKVDSPYNTYTNQGLPPGPIGNPGLGSIEAALAPTPSKYLYYLTGTDGKMYYAVTYAEHLRNQERYIK